MSIAFAQAQKCCLDLKPRTPPVDWSTEHAEFFHQMTAGQRLGMQVRPTSGTSRRSTVVDLRLPDGGSVNEVVEEHLDREEERAAQPKSVTERRLKKRDASGGGGGAALKTKKYYVTCIVSPSEVSIVF